MLGLLSRTRSAVTVLNPPTNCAYCAGEGQVAEEGEYDLWLEPIRLPMKALPRICPGFERPMPCPRCGGTGMRW